MPGRVATGPAFAGAAELSREREADFRLENSVDGIRVVVSDEFGLVKIEGPRSEEFTMTADTAEKLAMFIAGLVPVAGPPHGHYRKERPR